MDKPYFRMLFEPQLKEPIFVEGLRGFGNVGTIAARHLIESTGAKVFAELYAPMAQVYFVQPEARAASHRFYVRLLEAIRQRDTDAAESITREAMVESLNLWEAARH